MGIAQKQDTAWRGVVWSSVLRFHSCRSAEAYGRGGPRIGGDIWAVPSRRPSEGLKSLAPVPVGLGQYFELPQTAVQ